MPNSPETTDLVHETLRILRREKLLGRTHVYLPDELRTDLLSDRTGAAGPAPVPTPDPVRTVAPAHRPLNHARPHSVSAPASAAPGPPAVTPAAPAAAMGWDQLQAAVAHCTQCALCQGRTNTVFGEGDPNADLMFVGEGPGREEDLQGRPFVGRAGKLLDKMIAAMQFRREEVFIANIVKCRPPDNRIPHPAEAETCLPYLRRQIEFIQPRVIVLLGGTALKFLLNRGGIMKTRGTWLEFEGTPVMPTFHPSFLLRDPRRKRPVWEDLQQVMAVLGKDPTQTPRQQ